ncbi:MAG: ATP/GTP-binding protein [Microcystaceae cyanobacterium]
MLKSLEIKNFRCFKEYKLQQLGRVNLLVGMNNCGKTSILEAIHLLYSQDDLSNLGEIIINRGEFIWNNEGEKRDRELEIKYLFYNYKIDKNSQIIIMGNDHNQHPILKYYITLQENKHRDSLNAPTQPFYYISIKHKRELDIDHSLPALPNLNLLSMFLKSSVIPEHSGKLPIKTFFLASSSLTTQKMIDLFEQIVLTNEEELVIESLRIIEPMIKRIAVVNERFFVLLSDNDQRIPLVSMGDGIQRILGLTLALVNAKDGILLVDEIDTGLHFMAMSKMWKLVWETANKLNVQVFATTHNSDCWTSLTDLIDPENPREDGILLHRIEKDKPHSILFTEPRIVIAAENDIEVR